MLIIVVLPAELHSPWAASFHYCKGGRATKIYCFEAIVIKGIDDGVFLLNGKLMQVTTGVTKQRSRLLSCSWLSRLRYRGETDSDTHSTHTWLI